MDELWQRHKTFILQCVIGGLVFLIALVVMGNMYEGTDGEQVRNANLKNALDKQAKDLQAPSQKSIDEQKRKADEALAQIRKMAGQVASVAKGEDFVRENIVWVLQTIGRPRADAERYLDQFRKFPQTALTSVREEARTVLVSHAAQKGKSLDETFGLAAGVDEDQVAGGMHALAIICDVIRRALDQEGVRSVSDIHVDAENVMNRETRWISGVQVRLSITGDPDGVMAVIRSFNTLDPHASRMVVVKEVESISRRNPDDDGVKANLVLLGLQHKAVGE